MVPAFPAVILYMPLREADAGIIVGDPAYVDLEVFMTVLSNGYPVSVPSAR